MKRNDIHAGDELYCDRTKDWATDGSYGRKATVVDAGKWTIHYAVPTQLPDDAKGTYGVLCDVEYNGRTIREVTPIGHLRGPYEETRAAVTAAAEKKREQARVESQARTDMWEQASQMQDRANSLGLTVTTRMGDNGPVMYLSAQVLAVLLDAYDARTATTQTDR